MKTTTKDYNEFKKWVNHYMKAWGLNDWTVHFAHADINETIARCSSQTVSRSVTFVLGKEFETNGEAFSMKRAAKHETIHCLISNVSNLVGNYCSEDEYRSADEALVCRLTNLLED